MEKHITRQRLYLKARIKIVWMWLGGMSVRDISDESGASVSTVYRWIRRWQKEGTVSTRTNYKRSLIMSWKEDTTVVTAAQPRPRGAVDNESRGLSFYCNPQATDYLHPLVAPWGVGLFEVAVDGQDANVTQAQLSRVVDEARRLRQVSWCVTVVVMSDDPAFLAAFAEWSLKGRLLVWSTRLLVVTVLPAQKLRALIASYWTFSMMNTMIINKEGAAISRYGVYASLPYSPRGSYVVQVASWTPHLGLVFFTSLPLFPEKFSK
ncbi:putative variant ionotropic glutamate receptor-like 21 [Homarus americanus]|uniref:Putative variant ionotropic glutamate receptor-like 21 n=1 Tax=Homarus americanus TaxID=6706 RepID=A0A8J5TUR6_HOMAM|nr:putative variant ionotropic glutamate receptor-like 21 [Homarus americanus]